MPYPVMLAGRLLSEFDAKMQSYPEISSCAVDTEIFQGVNRSSMQLLKNRRGAKEMKCVIDFFGRNGYERTMHQSEFEALFLSTVPVDIDIGDGYFYRAVLTKAGNPETEGEYITTVEYTFRVTRHTAMQTAFVIPNDAKIYCVSNAPKTDCVIRILYAEMGSATNVYITLNGLVWSYAPELTGDLVLDGVNKIFTVGGVNVTNQIIWTDFPFLVSGENVLTLAVQGVVVGDKQAEISYTPTYL